jgi:hypothetical protein
MLEQLGVPPARSQRRHPSVHTAQEALLSPYAWMLSALAGLALILGAMS